VEVTGIFDSALYQINRTCTLLQRYGVVLVKCFLEGGNLRY